MFSTLSSGDEAWVPFGSFEMLDLALLRFVTLALVWQC